MANLKLQVRGLFKQTLPFIVWGIILATAWAYLRVNSDVHLFALTHPDQVRKAMAINRLGDMEKGTFINKVYGETIKSPVVK
jgi:hypothetical protein